MLKHTTNLKGLLEPGDYILARNGLTDVAIKGTGMENNQIGIVKNKIDCSKYPGCWTLISDRWKMITISQWFLLPPKWYTLLNKTHR